MKKIILLILLTSFRISQASCLNDYQQQLKLAVLSPLINVGKSIHFSFIGALSSSVPSIYASTFFDGDALTAGILYGMAFIYEAEYYVEDTYAKLRNFPKRYQAYNIIKEAIEEYGENLQNYHSFLNESLFLDNPIDQDSLIHILKEGNSALAFCPQEKNVYTKDHLSKYIKKFEYYNLIN